MLTQEKKRIAIVATGGTIASVAPNNTQLSDYKVDASINTLVAAVPALQEIADFEYQQVCNIESHHITDKILVAIARAVQTFCDRDDIDGVVITHGTDTLEETAYFLHLTIDARKPVVLVGAMRPASALSADGPLNLYNAVSVACSERAHAHGVLVVMNDRVASARHVTKQHANGVDAFGAGEFGFLGLVAGQDVEFQNRVVPLHTYGSQFRRLDFQVPLPLVDIIYDYQGAHEHHFEASIGAGARGLVLAATGNGSLSPQLIAGIKKVQSAGVVVVRASRVWQGVVRASVKDGRYATVAARTLPPNKARILLRLALAQAVSPDLIAKIFLDY
jgi:L-asparaginase